MATVMKVGGFRVEIHTHDHHPPHVHVRKAGGDVMVALGGGTERSSLIAAGGMKRADIAKAL